MIKNKKYLYLFNSFKFIATHFIFNTWNVEVKQARSVVKDVLSGKPISKFSEHSKKRIIHLISPKNKNTTEPIFNKTEKLIISLFYSENIASFEQIIDDYKSVSKDNIN